jgi:hypothetical protein
LGNLNLFKEWMSCATGVGKWRRTGKKGSNEPEEVRSMLNWELRRDIPLGSSPPMLAPFRALLPLVSPDRQLRPGTRCELAFWGSALVVLLCASLLRLLWLPDIEYKADEDAMYRTVRAVQDGAPWPALGFPSSQKAPAHGMMVWVFLALDSVAPSNSPTDLARLCQCLNLLAIAGLLVFIRTSVPSGSRATWLWATALVAVNPVAMVLQRKIWPISITPLFLLLVLVGFWYRDRRWGAALWGAMVQLVGMIHVGGLFLAVGLAAWALVFDRARVRWLWWALGSAAIAWGLFPWLHELVTTPTESTGQIKLGNPFTFSYWIRWVTEPLGISVHYSLGQDFPDFLRYPLLDGRPTYLMAVANGMLVLVALAVLLGGAVRTWRNRGGVLARFYGTDTQTPAVVSAVWFGLGLVFSLSFLPIHRHYMILTFPMMYVWAAVIALADREVCFRNWTRGQVLLLSSCVLQFAISLCFLSYIHDAGRTIRGDYGTPYAAQLAYGLPWK